MTTQSFDHQRLDVYRLSIEYVATSFDASESLTGRHRHARDQWLRAAQSIPLNIAEGNGKRSRKDRARFLDIARGSALECAAIQDVLLATKGIKVQDDAAMKAMLHRIVAMLTRMAMKFDGVAETSAGYQAGVDYDYEHRFAEHEHEMGAEETPEPCRAPEPGLRPLPNGQSTFPAR
ncbi:four helix bundle protein [Crateriforma spongiae]|uniref:four helix bundle protein n=1 Tax=Crateriforma spongiae TaxID=2724528 RepID=UPI001447760B|nr:four helix bundle protein [Crateriforma spongiae]